MENRGWNIRIVWGQRTKEENEVLVKKGVASRTSKHLSGEAVDLIDRKVGYSNTGTINTTKIFQNWQKKRGLLGVETLRKGGIHAT